MSNELINSIKKVMENNTRKVIEESINRNGCQDNTSKSEKPTELKVKTKQKGVYH